MDEDAISKSQNVPVDGEKNPDVDADTAPERIFDITPDLNISPITEEAEEASASLPISPTIPPTKQPSPIQQFTPIQPQVTSVRPQNTPPTIPLQDVSKTLAQARNTPAKTLGGFVAHIPTPTLPNSFSTPASPIAQTPPAPLNSPVTSIPPNSPTVPVPQKPAPPHSANNFSTLKSIRTFESDVADVMSHRRTSTASIAIAEAAKKEGIEKIETKAPSHSSRNFFFFIFSLILMGGGLIGAYYLYSKSPLAPSVTTTPTPKNNVGEGIVPADIQVLLPVDGLLPTNIISKIRAEISKSQQANTIKEIIPVLSQNEMRSRVSGPNMMNIMDVPAPDMVKRSLDSQWMLGVYSSVRGEKSVFVITTNNFFQNAFAGMLGWERLMSDDLKQYLYPSGITGIANAPANNVPSENTDLASSAISSSTPAIETEYVTPNFTIRGQFRDRIIANRDVREFVTSDEKTLFLYSFIDSDHMVLASDKSALAEIMTRLEKQAFIR